VFQIHLVASCPLRVKDNGEINEHLKDTTPGRLRLCLRTPAITESCGGSAAVDGDAQYGPTR
jgi:hypothetical protein